jgi:hypothetical protein
MMVENPSSALKKMFARLCLSIITLSRFNKGNILTLSRYPLHPTFAATQYPNGITDAHIQRRREKL